MQSGVGRMCEIFEQQPLKQFVKRNMDIAAFAGQTALNKWIRARAETVYHPVGTCRMGIDEGAVVDSELRVRGLDGLRVIDASVMPTVISGNTNLPVLAMAEKAADFIKKASS